MTNQKSLDKKKTKELDWEKEFDEEFWYDIDEGRWESSHYDENCFDIMDYVKKFISSLLDKQKEEILNLECLKEEEFIQMKEAIGVNEFIETRNQLRNEIKKEIKKL